MPLTILFDLDDTLLSTNMEAFLPLYFHALGESLSDLAPTKVLSDQIHEAVGFMSINRDPCLMLDEIFADHFYLPLGVSEKEYREQLDHFYRVEFPKLKHVTQPRPEARQLIEWCKTQGITMAIATNPLFPDAATRQRIEWAGLNPSDFVFYSTFNNFHFTKPNLTYYAECLGRLGWPEENTVMVGDNLTHDLQPMQEMGFPTFWVTSDPINDSLTHGTLGQVLPWLKEQQLTDRNSLLDTFEINQTILRSTPAVLDSWQKFLPADIFTKKPAKNEWGLTEIIWHLADLENEVYIPQWRQLLADFHSQITWPDTSHWSEERGYQKRSVDDAMAKFCKARLESLSLIEKLSNKNLLDKTIQHTTFSLSTIRELVSFCARHDRIHLQQSKELLDIYKIY